MATASFIGTPSFIVQSYDIAPGSYGSPGSVLYTAPASTLTLLQVNFVFNGAGGSFGISSRNPSAGNVRTLVTTFNAGFLDNNGTAVARTSSGVLGYLLYPGDELVVNGTPTIGAYLRGLILQYTGF
jgi:hypothetical protein